MHEFNKESRGKSLEKMIKESTAAFQEKNVALNKRKSRKLDGKIKRK